VANFIAVVAEDKLTQAVLHKCIQVYLPEFQISRSEVKGGRGNVQRELNAYSNLAKVLPVLVGVDLDGDECAPALLRKWQGTYQSHDNFLMRIAVREIESWVLADRKRFAKFIDGKSDDISKNPDAFEDPKLELLTLANQTAKAELRRELVPRNFGRYPRIGPAYNLQMCKFVLEKWRPHVAKNYSNSLSRAITAIQTLSLA